MLKWITIIITRNKQKKIFLYLGVVPTKEVMVLEMFWKKLFRWIVSIVKANAKPIVKRVGRAAVKTAVNIASDALDGQDIKESAKKRIIETINKKSEQTGDGILEKTVYKRKRKRKKKYLLKKKKRKLDIFDN